jgi:PAS domain S-box-containing protein
MIVGIAVFGMLDGSRWRTLLTPTVAYRPAILFALTLVFGWRGFVWSQLLFLISFTAFFGWRGAVFVMPQYLISQALGLFVAQRLARNQAWLLRERSTLAFLAGAVLAPALPALLMSVVARSVGINAPPGVPVVVDSWLRGAAGILALAPALLVYCSAPLRRWVALPSGGIWQEPITAGNVLELGFEVAAWTATLWLSVYFKARYDLNITYLTFLAPLTFTLFRGMALATLALASNAIVATTLWYWLNWANVLSGLDLRLLIGAYSVTILVLAAVVDERQRGRVQVAKLLSAEAALRESEERFRRVFDEGPLGLALVGKDFRYSKANRALCEMVGYDEAELVRMSFVDITHPDDVRVDTDLAERVFRGEIPFYRIQKRYVKKTGEIIWINLTASMIHGPDGKPLHGMAMVEDITEIRRTQEEALVRQKLESVGTLASGIAHDFNNLLGAIQAQAELASAELDAGSSCKEELNTIGEVATRGSEIVRQLMIYAGKETGVVELVDLSKTVDEMLSLIRVSVTKHAAVESNLARNLPPIRGSAAQLGQIVLNLVTNASDAIGDRDGVIRVSTRRVTPTEASIAIPLGMPGRDCVQLEVTDTGHGMSLQTQAKVFDPFFTTKSAGRGLGLAVVQGIVRSLDGAISITSQPGKGTTIRILLPCVEETDEQGGTAASGFGESLVPAKHGTVLVVEDESNLRQPVVKMLRKTGFEVFEAGDGSAAIELLGAHGSEIDVILLDVTIPGASSREVVAAAVNVRPDIPVVLTSAYGREMVEELMTVPQVRGFIRKPFEFAELIKTLRSCSSV